MDYWYRLVGLVDRSADEQKVRLAAALCKQLATMYRPECREGVAHRWEYNWMRIPSDLIVEHRGETPTPTRLAVLEFQMNDLFQFYVPDSSRNSVTREKVCEILDGLQDIVARGMA